MLLAYRSGSATRFFAGLSEGDPVAWVILGVVILFSAWSMWQKYRRFSS